MSFHEERVYRSRSRVGVWWGFAQVYGEAHDHKVASGGHKNDAVRLFRNFDKEVKDKTNVAPSIPELFDVDWKKICLDVRIIRLGRVHS